MSYCSPSHGRLFAPRLDNTRRASSKHGQPCACLHHLTLVTDAPVAQNPAVKDLYRELHRLREAEIEVVRNDITKEVKRSRQLRRAYAQERRRTEDAHAAGIDPVALQVEEEVGVFGRQLEQRLTCSLALQSRSQEAALAANSPCQYRRRMRKH